VDQRGEQCWWRAAFVRLGLHVMFFVSMSYHMSCFSSPCHLPCHLSSLHVIAHVMFVPSM
jgi:hypothetical protein